MRHLDGRPTDLGASSFTVSDDAFVAVVFSADASVAAVFSARPTPEELPRFARFSSTLRRSASIRSMPLIPSI